MSIAPTEAPAPILNAQTLCDRCPSRAYVLFVLKWSPGLPHAGELMMCGHHARIHEAAIAPYVSLMVDERWQLTKHATDDGGPR